MIRIAAFALSLVSAPQQGLPSDSAVRAFLLPRVAAFPDSGRHGEGIVVGLLDATGATCVARSSEIIVMSVTSIRRQVAPANPYLFECRASFGFERTLPAAQ